MQKICVKRIHLVTDDGLNGHKNLQKLFFIHPL